MIPFNTNKWTVSKIKYHVSRAEAKRLLYFLYPNVSNTRGHKITRKSKKQAIINNIYNTTCGQLIGTLSEKDTRNSQRRKKHDKQNNRKSVHQKDTRKTTQNQNQKTPPQRYYPNTP